jgi:hypothetical protein
MLIVKAIIPGYRDFLNLNNSFHSPIIFSVPNNRKTPTTYQPGFNKAKICIPSLFLPSYPQKSKMLSLPAGLLA